MLYAQGTTVLTAEATARAKEYMQSGYARELTFQHASDGSFSAFGSGDAKGSSWLSAAVLKTFAQASQLIFIDPAVQTKTASYLASVQNSDGSFRNEGTVVHGESLFGGAGSSGPVAFTAFVVQALIESGQQGGSSGAVSRGVAFLEKQAAAGTLNGQVYAQALTAYALTRAGSTSAALGKLLDALTAAAVTDTDGVHLKTQVGTEDAAALAATMPFCYRCGSMHSFDIEATGYYLLTRTRRNELGPALPLSKWLLSKKSSLGGFYSTQDTVVGIEALATYAKATRSATTNFNVQLFRSGVSAPLASITLDNSNADLLQTVTLDPALALSGQGPLSLVVTGTGKCMTQLAITYNTESDLISLAAPLFNLAVQYNQVDDAGASQIVTPCMGLSAAAATGGPSSDPGMSLLRVGLFTGFAPERTSLDALVSASVGKSGGVKRWEWDAQANEVVLYIDGVRNMQRLTQSPLGTSSDSTAATHVCVQFTASRVSPPVLEAAPALSSVHSYYQPAQRASVTVTRQAIATGTPPDVNSGNDGTPLGAATATASLPHAAVTALLVLLLAMAPLF
jgi:CD109 antigen